MRYLFPIILLLFLFSCRTVKFIEKEKTVIDSTSIEQNALLQKTLHETIERYEKQISEISKTGIVFDTIPCLDSTEKTKNKIEFFESGKVKSAEGRIKSVKSETKKDENEVRQLQALIDSLTEENERKDVQLSKKQETLVKEVRKTIWPWWIFGLCVIAGLIIEYKLKPVKRILSSLNFSIMRIFIFIFLILSIVSCGHFKNDPSTSVWAEGLWLVFWIPFLGSLWLYYRAYRSSKSGSFVRKNEDERWKESDKNAPIYKLPKFWIASVLQIFAWGVVWYVNSGYWQ